MRIIYKSFLKSTASTSGLAAVSCAVKRVTNVGDNVVLLTPVCNILFFNSVENHGGKVLKSRLIYKNGSCSIDFDDLEEKFYRRRNQSPACGMGKVIIRKSKIKQ